MQVTFTDYSDRSESQFRSLSDIQYVMIHRIAVANDEQHFSNTPADIARFFREHPDGRQATGGKMPYSILIAGDGAITQAVPLEKITPHARVYNQSAIGVGCIGDFRNQSPPENQYKALVEVCRSLLQAYGLSSDVLVGHDGLPDSSRDSSKECPGSGLSLLDLRRRVDGVLGGEVSGDMSFVFSSLPA